MQLKEYQKATLAALDGFLTRARATGRPRRSRMRSRDRMRWPEAKAARPTRVRTRLSRPCRMFPMSASRLPTGGGKTLLAAESIRIAASRFMGRSYPLTLWFVPSDTIKTQTLEALKDRTHAYRRRLDAGFGDRVRVIDIAEFERLRPPGSGAVGLRGGLHHPSLPCRRHLGL